MEAIDLLTHRRSVKAKDLTEPGPDAAQLERILTAAIRVPDHGKLAPWRVQVLDKPAQARLGDVFAQAWAAANPGCPDSTLAVERERPQRAPLLLVVTAHPSEAKPIPLMEQRLSGGAFCMNLLNAAHALGFGAQWLTEWPAYDPAVKQALGHAETTEIIAFIYIGTPATPPAERPRPAVADIATAWTG